MNIDNDRAGIGRKNKDQLETVVTRKNYVFGVAIDDYKNPNYKKLYNCKRDLNNFVNTVKRHYDSFSDDKMKLLYDKDASKSRIETEFKAFLDRLTEEDNLIIYFAGHGYQDEKMYYLLPHRAPEFDRYDDMNEISKKFISIKWMTDLIQKKNLFHVLIIFDSCYSGKIHNLNRDLLEDNDCSIEQIIESNLLKAYKVKSIWSLTSGSENQQVADGYRYEGSPFSIAINKVLISYGTNKKSISIAELGVKVRHRFDSKSEQLPTCSHGKDNKGGEFVFFTKEIKVVKEVESTTISTSYPYPIPTYRSSSVVQKPYNPLYDGRSSDNTDLKINQLYVVPILCLLGFWYMKSQEKDKEMEKQRSLTVQEKITNNRLLFDEDGNEIAEIGTKSDPHNYVDSVYVPTIYDAKTVRERGVYAQNNGNNYVKPNRNKQPKRTILTDLDGLKNSLVFAGSFVNQDNADKLVTHLKTMGYDKAEIVMKENLPYKVVVTGFYNHEKSAKKEVNALEKRGLDGYSTSNNLDEIYRKKSN